MATRVKKTPTPPVVSDEQLAETVRSLLADDTYTGEAMAPALHDLYAELGVEEQGAAKVHVSKLNCGDTGKEMGVWTGPPEDYDLQAIAVTHGSGEYRVKVYVLNADGSRPCRGNKVFGWSLSPEQEAARTAPKIAAQTAPQFDPQTLAQTIAAGVASALAPVLQHTQQQPSMLEMMTGMATLMKAMAPPPPPSSDPFAIMNATLGIMKTAQEMQPEREPIERGTYAGTADVVLGLINKFGPAFSAVLGQAVPPQMPEAAPQLVQLPNPGNNPVQQTIIPQQDQTMTLDTEQQRALDEAKMGIAFLKSAALRKLEPYDYVPMVLDYVPEETIEQWLADPDAVTKLAAIDPGLNDPMVRNWFVRLLDEVRKVYEDETPEAPVVAQAPAAANLSPS